MAEMMTLAVEKLRAQGAADAAALAARAVSGQATDQELLEQSRCIPTWRPRDFTAVPVGTPYQWQGTVYRLRQSHNAAGIGNWTPDAAPALWAAVSREGEDGTAKAPITAVRGTVYRLRQSHNAAGIGNWTPDAAPALWAAVSREGEDGTAKAPITAVRGMEYVYGAFYRDGEDGKLYQCRRSGAAEGGRIVLQYLPHELVGQYFVLVPEETEGRA